MAKSKRARKNKRTFRTSNQNENKRSPISGFTSIELITILPFLISLILGVGTFGLQIKEVTRQSSLCLHQLYSGTDLISKEMNALLELNPQAARLQKELKIAEIRLEAAEISGNAARIAACEAKVIQIKFRQADLDLIQKNKLARIEQIKKQMEISVKQMMRNDQPKYQSQQFKLIEQPPHTVAPVYRVPINFRSAQISKLKYKSILGFQNCSVSIEKRREYYRATLVDGPNEI